MAGRRSERSEVKKKRKRERVCEYVCRMAYCCLAYGLPRLYAMEVVMTRAGYSCSVSMTQVAQLPDSTKPCTHVFGRVGDGGG